MIYDGGCGLCERFVGLLRRWDRRGRFVAIPYQDPTVATRFPLIAAAEFAAALQLVGPAGERWAGAAAIERILDLLPAGRLVSWSFRVPLLGPLLDRGYRWFARHRRRLGCGAHCPPP